MKTISLARSLKIHGNVVVLAMTATVVLVRLVPLHAQSLDCSVFVSETSLKRGGMGAFSTKFLAQDEVIVSRLACISEKPVRSSSGFPQSFTVLMDSVGDSRSARFFFE